MKTKARKDDLVSQFKADAIIFKTDIPNDFFILSFNALCESSATWTAEFHVRNYEEEQVTPEDKADRAIEDPVTDEIEEDDVGNDDGCQEKKRRNFPRWERMPPR